MTWDEEAIGRRPVRTSPVTGAIIRVTVAAYVAELLSGDAAVATFALWPVGRFAVPELHAVVGFRWWQLVTTALLHGSVWHLFLNMFALHVFGRDVERALGARRHLELYGAAVTSASLVQLAVVSVAGKAYPTIGASGGVFGVLLAFGMLYPRRIVTLLFPPIPMPAWLFVTLYGMIELASGILGTQAGVAHFAHIGGMLGAYVLLRRWRRRARAALW